MTAVHFSRFHPAAQLTLTPHTIHTMRQLKYHEKKLLKKVDLYSWKSAKTEDNIRVAKVLRRYHIQNRNDYTMYNRIVGMIASLSAKLKTLPAEDSFRISMTDQLLTKLFNLGLISSQKSLQKADEVSVSAICRRRLPVLMVARLKMAQSLSQAVTYIEQGQVRIGPDVVTDPAYLVSRQLEDYITWTTTSKLKQSIQKYNNTLDDFDLL
jgi:U3 small nucleolar ribonucleoprotein protein IMP3